MDVGFQFKGVASRVNLGFKVLSLKVQRFGVEGPKKLKLGVSCLGLKLKVSRVSGDRRTRHARTHLGVFQNSGYYFEGPNDKD